MSDNVDFDEIFKMFEERDRKRAAQNANQNASQPTRSVGSVNANGRPNSSTRQSTTGNVTTTRRTGDVYGDYKQNLDRNRGDLYDHAQNYERSQSVRNTTATATRRTYAPNRNDDYGFADTMPRTRSTSQPRPVQQNVSSNSKLNKDRIERRRKLKRKILLRRATAIAIAAVTVGGLVFGISRLTRAKEGPLPPSNPSGFVTIAPKDDETSISTPDVTMAPDEIVQPAPEEMVLKTKFSGYTDEELMNYKNPEFTYMGNYGDKQYLYANDDYIMQICANVVEKINEASRASGYAELPEDFALKLFGIAKMESSGRIEDANGNPLAPSVGGSARGMFQMQPAAVADGLKYLKTLGLNDDFGIDSNNVEGVGRQNPYKEAALAGGVFAWMNHYYGSKVEGSIDLDCVKDNCYDNWMFYAYNQGIGNAKRALWGNEEYYESLLKDYSSEEARQKADAKHDGFYDYINGGLYSNNVAQFSKVAEQQFMTSAPISYMGE